MPGVTTRALTAGTWPDVAALAEAHNGVWNGCWCMAFHDWDIRHTSQEQNRTEKQRRVVADEAHAALVYEGDACVGVVEGYPDDPTAGKLSAAFLWCGTTPLFERHGFEVTRAIGKSRRVARRRVG